MIAAATLLALALFAGDSAPHRVPAVGRPYDSTTCVSPARTGTFRLMTSRAGDGGSIRPALLVLENINGCLEATFVTDGAGPAIIDRLAVQGDELTGRLKLQTGDAKVSIRFDAGGVAGSIVEGRHQWNVEGHKTS